MDFFSDLRDEEKPLYSLVWSPEDDPSPLKIPKMSDDVTDVTDVTLTEKFVFKWYLDGWLHILRRPQDYQRIPLDRSSNLLVLTNKPTDGSSGILDQWRGDYYVAFFSKPNNTSEPNNVISQTKLKKLKSFLDQLSIGIEQLAPDTVFKVPYRDMSDVYDEISDFLRQIGEISEFNLSTSVDEEFFHAWHTDKELALDKAKFGRPKPTA